jgi:hypothetical protein
MLMPNVISDYASKAVFGVLDEAAVNPSRRKRILYSMTAVRLCPVSVYCFHAKVHKLGVYD